MGKLRFFQKINISSWIHNTKIFMMIADHRLGSRHLACININLRHQADD